MMLHKNMKGSYRTFHILVYMMKLCCMIGNKRNGLTRSFLHKRKEEFVWAACI